MAYCCGGCAALSLDAISGAVSGAAAPVQDILTAGKLHTAEMVDLRSAVVAARWAASDLTMREETIPPAKKEKDPEKVEMWFADDKSNRLVVKLEKRGRNLTLVDLDVGFFGSDPIVRLFFDHMRTRLPPEARTARGSLYAKPE